MMYWRIQRLCGFVTFYLNFTMFLIRCLTLLDTFRRTLITPRASASFVVAICVVLLAAAIEVVYLYLSLHSLAWRGILASLASSFGSLLFGAWFLLGTDASAFARRHMPVAASTLPTSSSSLAPSSAATFSTSLSSHTVVAGTSGAFVAAVEARHENMENIPLLVDESVVKTCINGGRGGDASTARAASIPGSGARQQHTSKRTLYTALSSAQQRFLRRFLLFVSIQFVFCIAVTISFGEFASWTSTGSGGGGSARPLRHFRPSFSNFIDGFGSILYVVGDIMNTLIVTAAFTLFSVCCALLWADIQALVERVRALRATRRGARQMRGVARAYARAAEQCKRFSENAVAVPFSLFVLCSTLELAIGVEVVFGDQAHELDTFQGLNVARVYAIGGSLVIVAFFAAARVCEASVDIKEAIAGHVLQCLAAKKSVSVRAKDNGDENDDNDNDDNDDDYSSDSESNATDAYANNNNTRNEENVNTENERARAARGEKHEFLSTMRFALLAVRELPVEVEFFGGVRVTAEIYGTLTFLVLSLGFVIIGIRLPSIE